MTVFSDPLEVPWVREPPKFTTGQASPMQDAVRIADDIALIGYGEDVVTTNQPANSYLTVGTFNLRGVRYTDEGPELGPELHVPTPAGSNAQFLEAIIPGADGEAWILSTVSNWTTGTASYMQVGRVTIDQSTLQVSVSWRGQVPLLNGGNSYVHADLWLAGRTLVTTVAFFTQSPSTYHRYLYLVNIDTGLLTASAPLPIAYTRGIETRALSFHPERQEVLLVADRITGGYWKPNLWTVPITATSIGAFTRVLMAGLPAEGDDITIEGWSAAPISGGRWKMAGSYYTSLDDFPYELGNYQQVHHYIFTPPTTIAESPTSLSELGVGDWMGHSSSIDVEVNDDDTIAVGNFEMTDRGLSTPGTGIGGVRHTLLASDATTIVESQILPMSNNIWQDGGSLNVVSLGAGRFIYLVSGPGITIPLVSLLASFQFVVYAGGPNVAAPFVPGIKGAAPPEENRRAFRRVN